MFKDRMLKISLVIGQLKNKNYQIKDLKMNKKKIKFDYFKIYNF